MFENAAKQIVDDGIFVARDLLSADVVNELAGLCLDPALNENTIQPVRTVHQSFLTHYLAVSKAAYDLVTSDAVLDLCDQLMSEYRLVSKRVYETRAGMKMQWHSDCEALCSDPKQVDALVFIFYLTDVKVGGYQYIEGSHVDGADFVGGAEKDAEIDAKYLGRVKTLSLPAGSCIVYNGRLLHRASRFETGPARRSLFFQVNRGARTSEPIYLNAAFIDNLDSRRERFLGIGKPAIVPSFPKGGISAMHLSDRKEAAKIVYPLKD